MAFLWFVSCLAFVSAAYGKLVTKRFAVVEFTVIRVQKAFLAFYFQLLNSGLCIYPNVTKLNIRIRVDISK